MGGLVKTQWSLHVTKTPNFIHNKLLTQKHKQCMTPLCIYFGTMGPKIKVLQSWGGGWLKSCPRSDRSLGLAQPVLHNGASPQAHSQQDGQGSVWCRGKQILAGTRKQERARATQQAFGAELRWLKSCYYTQNNSREVPGRAILNQRNQAVHRI